MALYKCAKSLSIKKLCSEHTQKIPGAKENYRKAKSCWIATSMTDQIY